MMLKRLYDPETKKMLSVVKVIRAKDRQNFSPEFLNNPFVSMSNGKIVIHGEDGVDVVYRILATPGHYCAHCDEEIVDGNQVVEGGMTKGMQHVKEAHGNAKSPDPESPAGYCKINYYECVKE